MRCLVRLEVTQAAGKILEHQSTTILIGESLTDNPLSHRVSMHARCDADLIEDLSCQQLEELLLDPSLVHTLLLHITCHKFYEIYAAFMTMLATALSDVSFVMLSLGNPSWEVGSFAATLLCRQHRISDMPPSSSAVVQASLIGKSALALPVTVQAQVCYRQA